MKRPRFSIAALMVAIVILSLGLAALRYPNKLWESFYYSIPLAVLVFALLGVLFHRGLSRAFWGGFALSGWFYMLLNFGPWFADSFSPYLFTTACLDLIYPHVAAPEQAAMAVEGARLPNMFGLAGAFGGGGFGGGVVANDPWKFWTEIDNAASGFNVANNFQVDRSRPFQMIGHALFALLFAYLGGIAARRFARLGARPVAPE
jgi:hypothetical protein